jgi:hypothetical protein
LALRRHGVHVFYGDLMGVPTLQPTDLPASILLTYPQVFDHVPDQDTLRARVGDVFDLVVNGDLTPSIGRRYDLADAPQAHRHLAFFIVVLPVDGCDADAGGPGSSPAVQGGTGDLAVLDGQPSGDPDRAG